MEDFRIGEAAVVTTTGLGDATMTERSQRVEMDIQISTAKAFPRSITKFRNDVEKMATLTEDIAADCLYALPRDGKTIEGPSARMAEIILTAWGNARAAARVIEVGDQFVTAQGVFHDLERNVSISQEVKRRITGRGGRRYSDDLIVQAANAACSIAVRNAVLRGVPKAYWIDAYTAARKVVAGDAKTLANRRADALAWLQKVGVTEAMVVETLGVAGVADIGLDHLVVLRGIAAAIRDGETTVEEAFPKKAAVEAPPIGAGLAGLKARLEGTPDVAAGAPVSDPAPAEPPTRPVEIVPPEAPNAAGEGLPAPGVSQALAPDSEALFPAAEAPIATEAILAPVDAPGRKGGRK